MRKGFNIRLRMRFFGSETEKNLLIILTTVSAFAKSATIALLLIILVDSDLGIEYLSALNFVKIF